MRPSARLQQLAACMIMVSCSEQRTDATADAGVTRTAAGTHDAAALPVEAKPQLLYLPDAGDLGPPQLPGQELLPGPWGFRSTRCPAEMVDVGGRFCIDRFEVRLVDRTTRRELSPYYHPTRTQLRRSYEVWQRRRLESGTSEGRLLPVPPPPAWQLDSDFEPSAESRGHVVPSGYMSGRIAEQACHNAGKRLCTLDEWQLACRGPQGRKFPYGEQYRPGLCNVARDAHPAALLHGNASINHLDPRLNITQYQGQPLLRETGTSEQCKSDWGGDAVYDMVGNLDEWIEDPEGTFVGGFYSRATHEGCDARITSHDYGYFDYSLGTRCCK